MGLFLDAPVPAEALTAFVREVPFGANLGLTNLFGRRDLDDRFVDFAEITRTNRTARYRSWDGRVHVSERDTGSEAKVPLIPLSSSLNMGEYERVQLEMARNGGTNTARLANAIYNDADQLTREVQNRIEMAWGDALSDGVLTISEGGLTGTAGTVDFGVPAGQKVTAGTNWDTIATAPALTDLETIVEDYITANGFAPGYVLTSNRQHRNLRRNTQIINAVGGTNSGRTRVGISDVRDLLASELGGLQLLEPYDSSFDVDGVTTRVLPDDKVILLPPNLEDVGYTAWGVSVTAMELVGSAKVDFSFEQAAGIVGIVNKGDSVPFRQEVVVDAVALPIITNGKLMSILDVAP